MLASLVHRIARYFESKNEIDFFFGHPKASHFMELVEGGRWNELECAYAELSVDQRNIVLDGISNRILKEDGLDSWATPTPTALLFKGVHLTHSAWRARSGVIGKFVPKSAAQKFYDCLGMGFDNLYQAFKQSPSDPEPAARLVRVLMGLGEPKDQVYACFERVSDSGVFHLGACNNMIEALAEKWLGSHEEMFAFARTQASKDPRYSSAVALAHAEQWLSICQDADESTADKYLLRPDVIEEILAAHRSDPLVGDENSYFSLLAMNSYAFALFKAKQVDLAAGLLKVIGARMTSKPWCYQSPVARSAVNKARKVCGLPWLYRDGTTD